jgi:hypothetical protein
MPGWGQRSRSPIDDIMRALREAKAGGSRSLRPLHVTRRQFEAMLNIAGGDEPRVRRAIEVEAAKYGFNGYEIDQ